MRKFGDALSVMFANVMSKLGLYTRGKTFYVYNSTGQDGGFDGLTPDQPFKTLEYAINKCTANKGDRIVLLEGHNEGSTGVIADLDIAGVEIVGQGTGSLIPTLDYDNAAATLDIGANDITIRNVRFRPSVTAVLIGIDIESGVTGTTIENCEFAVGEDGAGVDEFVVPIKLVSGNDDTIIRNNLILTHDSAAHATHAISIAAAAKRVQIRNNVMFGTFSTGGIVEGAQCYDMQYIGNRIRTGTNVACITANAATTGLCQDNYCVTATLAVNSMISASAMALINNWGSNAAGTGGALIAALLDDPDNILGADTNNNTFASTNVVANEDGSLIERLEQIQEAVNIGSGTSLASNKSLVDALGTTGSAITDSATSVIGVMGADNNNNAFSSSSVVANADGSILERQEAIQAVTIPSSTYVPGLGYRVTKTEDVNTATGDDLFTITGKVLITCWNLSVTDALAAGVSDYKIRVKTDNVDLCAASNIGSAAIGFQALMNSDAGDTLINTARATNAADTNGKGLAYRVVGKTGGTCTLESNRTAGDAGDAIIHTVFYLPLDGVGAVTAAA